MVDFYETSPQTTTRTLQVLRAHDFQRDSVAGNVVDARDKSFVVRGSDRVSILRVRDVQWIESAGNYVGVHTAGGRLLARETMANIAARLPSELFVRIHRGAIVNVLELVEIRRLRRGRVVTLRSGERLRVGRTYQAGLERAIDAIQRT